MFKSKKKKQMTVMQKVWCRESGKNAKHKERQAPIQKEPKEVSNLSKVVALRAPSKLASFFFCRKKK